MHINISPQGAPLSRRPLYPGICALFLYIHTYIHMVRCISTCTYILLPQGAPL